jgi:hypothetical protein
MKGKTCKTCGGDDFIVAETRTGGLRVPAVECSHCHMLDQDESTACSKKDLDSARMAIAANLSVVAEPSSWNDEPDTLVDARNAAVRRLDP